MSRSSVHDIACNVHDACVGGEKMRAMTYAIKYQLFNAIDCGRLALPTFFDDIRSFDFELMIALADQFSVSQPTKVQ
jgi:hypothetical protein